MKKDLEGPIEAFEWGRFQINGQIHSEDGEGAGKDIFVWGGEVSPWTARKGHRLKPYMVACAFAKDIDILVIGSGVRGAIDVKEKTRQAIHTAGIERLIIQRTPEACAIYNRLYHEGEKVALLAHGTC